MCVFLLITFAVVNARAGSLALISCAGTSANEGWKTFFQGSISGAITESSCSERWMNEAGEPWGYPAGMEASLQPGNRSDAGVGLVFNPPEGESIVGGDITVGPVGQVEPPYERVRFDPGGGEVPSKRVELALDSLENVFWFGVKGEPSTVTIPSTGGGPLYVSALCGGEPGRVCSSQTIYVPAAHILLSPTVAPSVSAISGPLAAAGVMHGTQGVSLPRPMLKDPVFTRLLSRSTGKRSIRPRRTSTVAYAPRSGLTAPRLSFMLPIRALSRSR